MAASSRLMITEAERRFPARIRIGLPPGGLGRQLDIMTAWLDATPGWIETIETNARCWMWLHEILMITSG